MKSLAATSAAVAATAVVGGVAGRPDTRWYAALRKPFFQPPPVVFPIVWPALYASIAGASATVLDRTEGDEQRDFAVALGTNLALNAGWTWTFFRAQRPGLATVHSAVLAASSIDLARRAGRVSPGARQALTPYIAWTGFATALSGSIAWLNRRK